MNNPVKVDLNLQGDNQPGILVGKKGGGWIQEGYESSLRLAPYSAKFKSFTFKNKFKNKKIISHSNPCSNNETDPRQLNCQYLPLMSSTGMLPFIDRSSCMFM